MLAWIAAVAAITLVPTIRHHWPWQRAAGASLLLDTPGALLVEHSRLLAALYAVTGIGLLGWDWLRRHPARLTTQTIYGQQFVLDEDSAPDGDTR